VKRSNKTNAIITTRFLAHLGEPHSRAVLAQQVVYPRVGGGALFRPSPEPPIPGLSPRGRGSHIRPDDGEARAGSIPAWAGEPGDPGSGETLVQVYPRVGGGAPTLSPLRSPNEGLSPRGRGSQRQTGVEDRGGGSIPAWAGEPCRLSPVSPRRWVYPRVGGGAHGGGAPMPAGEGLSPRGRGSR